MVLKAAIILTVAMSIVIAHPGGQKCEFHCVHLKSTNGNYTITDASVENGNWIVNTNSCEEPFQEAPINQTIEEGNSFTICVCGSASSSNNSGINGYMVLREDFVDEPIQFNWNSKPGEGISNNVAYDEDLYDNIAYYEVTTEHKTQMFFNMSLSSEAFEGLSTYNNDHKKVEKRCIYCGHFRAKKGDYEVSDSDITKGKWALNEMCTETDSPTNMEIKKGQTVRICACGRKYLQSGSQGSITLKGKDIDDTISVNWHVPRNNKKKHSVFCKKPYECVVKPNYKMFKLVVKYDLSTSQALQMH